MIIPASVPPVISAQRQKLLDIYTPSGYPLACTQLRAVAMAAAGTNRNSPGLVPEGNGTSDSTIGCF